MNSGFTHDERVLSSLGYLSFLRMWTWPNLFRNQGKASTEADGKELCDLLIVFGDYVIIFSDKRIRFNTNKPELTAWCRWVRRALSESYRQIEGAERWINNHGDRIFVDQSCTNPLPISLPDQSRIRFFRVVVAHGIEEQLTGSDREGSLSFTNRLVEEQNWNAETAEPFRIGSISKDKFVHVFTDETIKLVLKEFDTVIDFIEYLAQRERVLTLGKPVDVDKESDLVRLHYEHYSDEVRARSILIAPDLQPEIVRINKGSLKDLYANESFQRKKQADRVSYFWDELVESFAFHALNGSSEAANWTRIEEVEPAFRYMADQSRFSRRLLAKNFLDFYKIVPPGRRGTRVVMDGDDGEIAFLFLLLPHDTTVMSNQKYRDIRRELLEDYALIQRGRNPQIKSVLGIGAKTRHGDGQISRKFFNEGQDYLYCDYGEWGAEQVAQFEELEKNLVNQGLLAKQKRTEFHHEEFPD